VTASNLSKLAPIIVLLGIVITFAAMLHEGSPGDLARWSGIPVFGTWVLLPFLVLLGLSLRWRSSPAAQKLLAVAGVLATLSAALEAQYESFRQALGHVPLEAFVARILELDAHGHGDKTEVYRAVVNVAGAHDAGLRGVWRHTPYWGLPEVPCYTIRNLDELRGLVEVER
jgi:hypothetical protein